MFNFVQTVSRMYHFSTSLYGVKGTWELIGTLILFAVCVIIACEGISKEYKMIQRNYGYDVFKFN